MQPSRIHIALVVSASGKIEATTVPTKQPKTGEILISPLRAGICGTDLEIIRRVRCDTATILGHEGVAEVVELGLGVVNFSVGQKVIFNPVNPNNQHDILGHSTEGLFQQRLLILQPAIEGGLVVPFDTRVPLICGPLVEPLGTVIYGQSLVDQVCRPKCIAIIGAGPIGLLHALYARAQGCSNIFLVDNVRERLNWAMQRRIIKTDEGFLNSPGLDAALLDRTSGNGVDAIYMCTTHPGALEALRQALKFLRFGGCVDLVGGFSDGDMIPDLPGVDLNSIRRTNCCGLPQNGVVFRCHNEAGKEMWLTGHRGTSELHLQAAMELLRKQPTRYASIISHVVSLQAAPLIFERLVNAQTRKIQGEECVKVIIDFTIEDPEGSIDTIPNFV